MSVIEKALEKMQHRAAAATIGSPNKIATVAPAPRPLRVVEIDQAALRRSGMLPPEHQAGDIARQYRQIKRPLVDNAFGHNTPRAASSQLIMLASAIAGEGKTFTSVNLAFSLALEKDVHVVLVDADVIKPQTSRVLGLDKEPGLLDVLQDPNRDIESVILPTNVRNLSVVPAGNRLESATELLASERMREICKRMTEVDPHRIILFDSPPLLLTSESQTLAQVAGQIVVVVRASTTPQRMVLDALRHIPEGKRAALILNQSVAAAETNYYYYDNTAGGPDRAQSA
jgi:exopolysaccharide/PEP-CTERM locus tyrosine autokinase